MPCDGWYALAKPKASYLAHHFHSHCSSHAPFLVGSLSRSLSGRISLTLPLWPALSLTRSVLTKCNFAFDRQTNVKIYTCSCSTNAKHHRIFLSIVSFCTNTHTHRPYHFPKPFHSFSIFAKWPCIIQSTLWCRILHQFFIVPLSLFRCKISFSLIFCYALSVCHSLSLHFSFSKLVNVLIVNFKLHMFNVQFEHALQTNGIWWYAICKLVPVYNGTALYCALYPMPIENTWITIFGRFVINFLSHFYYQMRAIPV